MTLRNYEHEVQGFAFGLPIDVERQIKVESWSGYGRPDQNVADVTPPQADGTWFGQDWLGPRTFTWTLHLVAVNDSAVMALHDELADAWTFAGRRDPAAVTTYRSKIPGRETMVAFGRPRRFTPVFDQMIFGIIDVACDFYCGDPLLYSDDEQTVVIPLSYASGSGAVVPASVPLALSAPADAGGIEPFINRGNAQTWPVVTFAGPTLGPRLTNATTGEFLDFPELALTAGQSVTVDTRPIAHTVLRENGGSAYGLLAPGSSLFGLDPGQTDLQFTARRYDSGALCTVTARSAWER